MLDEIKILDDNENEIMPQKKNLVTIPVNGKHEFITVPEARNIIKILIGQINIIEAQKVERKTGYRKHNENINHKTGGAVRSA